MVKDHLRSGIEWTLIVHSLSTLVGTRAGGPGNQLLVSLLHVLTSIMFVSCSLYCSIVVFQIWAQSRSYKVELFLEALTESGLKKPSSKHQYLNEQNPEFDFYALISYNSCYNMFLLCFHYSNLGWRRLHKWHSRVCRKWIWPRLDTSSHWIWNQLSSRQYILVTDTHIVMYLGCSPCRRIHRLNQPYQV